MINVNIRYKGKELSTVLPKSNNELNADLKKAGIDIPAEKLKLRSSPKDKYLVGLYTNNPLDDLIIDRLCKQIITMYQHIGGVGITIVLGWIVEQDARFYLRLLVLAYPCEFKFLHFLYLRLYDFKGNSHNVRCNDSSL